MRGPGHEESHGHEEVDAVALNDGGSRTVVQVVDGDVVVTTVEVEGPATPDLAVVATLARLRLMARRMGWTIRLEQPCTQLCELLRFVGLDDLLLDQGPGLVAELAADDVVDLRTLCEPDLDPKHGPEPPA
jgi:hypothetical protein